MAEVTEMLDDSSEDAKFVISEEYFLWDLIANEYGIDVGIWRPKLWRSVYEDLMTGLERMGFVAKAEKDKE